MHKIKLFIIFISISLFISVCDIEVVWMEENIVISIDAVTFVSRFQWRVLYLFYCAIKWLHLGNMLQRYNSAFLYQYLCAEDSTNIRTNPIICLAHYHLTTYIGSLILDYSYAKTVMKMGKCHKKQSRMK